MLNSFQYEKYKNIKIDYFNNSLNITISTSLALSTNQCNILKTIILGTIRPNLINSNIEDAKNKFMSFERLIIKLTKN